MDSSSVISLMVETLSSCPTSFSAPFLPSMNLIIKDPIPSANCKGETAKNTQMPIKDKSKEHKETAIPGIKESNDKLM